MGTNQSPRQSSLVPEKGADPPPVSATTKESTSPMISEQQEGEGTKSPTTATNPSPVFTTEEKDPAPVPPTYEARLNTMEPEQQEGPGPALTKVETIPYRVLPSMNDVTNPAPPEVEATPVLFSCKKETQVQSQMSPRNEVGPTKKIKTEDNGPMDEKLEIVRVVKADKTEPLETDMGDAAASGLVDDQPSAAVVDITHLHSESDEVPWDPNEIQEVNQADEDGITGLPLEQIAQIMSPDYNARAWENGHYTLICSGQMVWQYLDRTKNSQGRTIIQKFWEYKGKSYRVSRLNLEEYNPFDEMDMCGYRYKHSKYRW